MVDDYEVEVHADKHGVAVYGPDWIWSGSRDMATALSDALLQERGYEKRWVYPTGWSWGDALYLEDEEAEQTVYPVYVPVQGEGE